MKNTQTEMRTKENKTKPQLININIRNININYINQYITQMALVQITLYYEVPQNALCSLCLHCLNTGSEKPKGPLSPAESSQGQVRYRCTAVKRFNPKDLLQSLLQ